MTRIARRSFLILLAFSFAYGLYIPVHPDEAYYWNWSRHLALSYFDGPPLVAYLIKLSTLFFGQTKLALKLISVVCVMLSGWIVHTLAARLFDKKVAEKALIIFLLLPITQATNILTTPDVPLLLFTCLTLWFFWQWFSTQQHRYLYACALTFGLGLLAKYTMILIAPALLGFMLSKPRRDRLRTYHLIPAVLLALLAFSPVIIWNILNHWQSFQFQWHHGTAQHHIQMKYIGDFIAGQLGSANPIFFIAFIVLAIRYRHHLRETSCQFLLWPTLFPFFFFFFFALSNHSEMNWTLPLYSSGSILMAYLLEQKPHQRIYYAGIIFSLCAICLLKFPTLTPANWQSHALIRKFFGYKQTIAQIDPMYLQHNPIILSNSYQNASEIAFHLPTQPNVYIITPTRTSQYTQWSQPLMKKGAIAQAFYIGDRINPQALAPYFKSCQLTQTVSHHSHMVNKKWVVLNCVN